MANLWPNRLIGDATLPIEKRRTLTNVRTYDTMASGTYGCTKCADRKKSGNPAPVAFFRFARTGADPNQREVTPT